MYQNLLYILYQLISLDFAVSLFVIKNVAITQVSLPFLRSWSVVREQSVSMELKKSELRDFDFPGSDILVCCLLISL